MQGAIGAAAQTSYADSTAVRELTTVMEFEQSLRECSTYAVVKFYKRNCRLCRAVAPKFEQLAREFHGRAEFFAVDLSTGSQVFSRERIGVAPSIIAYCGPVGRIAASTTSQSLSDLRRVLDDLVPERVAALRTVSPAALRPLMRYVAIVGVLRGLRNARLSPSPCQPSDLGPQLWDELRPDEVAEIHSTFAALDRDADGLVTADDLVAATQALTPYETPATQSSRSRLIAPSRLAASGVAFERELIEAAIRASCSADSCVGDTCADTCDAEASEEGSLAPPAMGLTTFAHMMARALIKERKARQKGDPLSRQATVSAAYTALDRDGDQSVCIECAVGTLEAMCVAFPEGQSGSERDGSQLDSTRDSSSAIGAMDGAWACPQAQGEGAGLRAAFEAFGLRAETDVVDRAQFVRMATRQYSY